MVLKPPHPLIPAPTKGGDDLVLLKSGHEGIERATGLNRLTKQAMRAQGVI
jgi:hypothetical protein